MECFVGGSDLQASLPWLDRHFLTAADRGGRSALVAQQSVPNF